MNIKFWSLFFFLCVLTWQQVIAAERLITLQEIKSHNNVKNCWIIVDAKVYDVTNLIAIHDTYCEKTKLTDYCGGDVSAIWQEKQKSNNAHKRKSILEFERSYIGKVLEP